MIQHERHCWHMRLPCMLFYVYTFPLLTFTASNTIGQQKIMQAYTTALGPSQTMLDVL